MITVRISKLYTMSSIICSMSTESVMNTQIKPFETHKATKGVEDIQFSSSKILTHTPRPGNNQRKFFYFFIFYESIGLEFGCGNDQHHIFFESHNRAEYIENLLMKCNLSYNE